MKKCDYCGKEGDDSRAACWSCGTPYEEQPLTVDQRGSIRIWSGAIIQSVGTVIRWGSHDWVHANLGLFISLIGLCVFTWGCMWYARAKGYPRVVGLLGLLTILGLLALFFLPNRSKEPKKSDPAVSPTEPQIPQVTADELAAKIRAVLPNSSIEITPINSEHGSRTLHVKQGNLDIEFVWGPLSGFGGRDLTRPTTSEDTPFDYADEQFQSMDDALEFLYRLSRQYP